MSFPLLHIYLINCFWESEKHPCSIILIGDGVNFWEYLYCKNVGRFIGEGFASMDEWSWWYG